MVRPFYAVAKAEAAGTEDSSPPIELVVEPAVQPAAIRPAVTITPYLVRRLMPYVLTAV